ncbi:MAG: hypothetical protein JKY56_08170 [Kofleriaceae bacterium]|nr:hypothetical protein [Kofleriaceae bacterium]
MKSLLAAIVCCVGLGCGGASSGLGVTPGQSRAEAEDSLERSKYCRGGAATHKIQKYGRCGVTGFENVESWVVVNYSKTGKVVRARRMERFGSHREAVKGWNLRWEERRKELGKSSKEARVQLGVMGETPEGAITWKVWFSASEGHLIGLYLVKPADASDAQVVEVIRAR